MRTCKRWPPELSPMEMEHLGPDEVSSCCLESLETHVAAYSFTPIERSVETIIGLLGGADGPPFDSPVDLSEAVLALVGDSRGFREGRIFARDGRPAALIGWMEDVGVDDVFAAVVWHHEVASACNLAATVRRPFWHSRSHAWTFELARPGDSILGAGHFGHDLVGPHPLGRGWM